MAVGKLAFVSLIFSVFAAVYCIPVSDNSLPDACVTARLPKSLGGEKGVFLSPSTENGEYPSDMHCEWDIQVPVGMIVEISFQRFDLEESVACTYDHVTLLDGGPDGRLLKRMCGSDGVAESPILSMQNIVRVIFRSDSFSQGTGFKGIFRQLDPAKRDDIDGDPCDGTPLIFQTFDNGVFTSNLPGRQYYSYNQICEWRFLGPPGTIFQLTSLNFNIEYSDKCVKDHLTIYDGSDPSYAIIGKFCGFHAQSLVFNSTGNALCIRFTSDNTTSGTGFRFEFKRCESEDIVKLLEKHYDTIGTNVISGKGSKKLNKEVKISPTKVVPAKAFTKPYTVFPRGAVQNDESVKTKLASFNVAERFNVVTKDAPVPFTPTSPQPLAKTNMPITTGQAKHAVISTAPGEVASTIPQKPSIYSSTTITSTLSVATSSKKTPYFDLLVPKKMTSMKPLITTVATERATISTESPRFLTHLNPGGRYKTSTRTPGPRRTTETHKIGHSTIRTGVTDQWTPTEEKNVRLVASSEHSQLKGEESGDENECRSSLERVTASTGFIKSPNYPAKYRNGLHCEWDLTAPKGKVIRFEMEALSIEFHPTCEYDSLTIKGKKHNSDQEYGTLVQYCGSYLPNPTFIITSSRSARVVFHTDELTNKNGFSAKYAFIDCPNDGEYYECGSSECLSARTLCDGNNDCRDGGDESGTFCKIDCGLSSIDSVGGTARILGGAPVDSPTLWPWVAGIVNRSGKLVCGAALIAPRWVVTSAHCLRGESPGQKKIHIGSHMTHNLNHPSRKNGISNLIDISKIFKHPEYNNRTMEHDLALIELSRSAQVGNTVSSICLPDADNPVVDGQMCVMVGWGAVKAGETKGVKVLQAVTLPVLTSGMCRENSIYGNAIKDSMLCAGDVNNGGKDACSGDSGGPLQCRVRGAWTIIGVASWGSGCGQPDKPGVYTRLTDYLTWIWTVMSKN